MASQATEAMAGAVVAVWVAVTPVVGRVLLFVEGVTCSKLRFWTWSVALEGWTATMGQCSLFSLSMDAMERCSFSSWFKPSELVGSSSKPLNSEVEVGFELIFLGGAAGVVISEKECMWKMSQCVHHQKRQIWKGEQILLLNFMSEILLFHSFFSLCPATRS